MSHHPFQLRVRNALATHYQPNSARGLLEDNGVSLMKLNFDWNAEHFWAEAINETISCGKLSQLLEAVSKTDKLDLRRIVAYYQVYESLKEVVTESLVMKVYPLKENACTLANILQEVLDEEPQRTPSEWRKSQKLPPILLLLQQLVQYEPTLFGVIHTWATKHTLTLYSLSQTQIDDLFRSKWKILKGEISKQSLLSIFVSSNRHILTEDPRQLPLEIKAFGKRFDQDLWGRLDMPNGNNSAKDFSELEHKLRPVFQKWLRDANPDENIIVDLYLPLAIMNLVHAGAWLINKNSSESLSSKFKVNLRITDRWSIIEGGDVMDGGVLRTKWESMGRLPFAQLEDIYWVDVDAFSDVDKCECMMQYLERPDIAISGLSNSLSACNNFFWLLHRCHIPIALWADFDEISHGLTSLESYYKDVLTLEKKDLRQWIREKATEVDRKKSINSRSNFPKIPLNDFVHRLSIMIENPDTVPPEILAID